MSDIYLQITETPTVVTLSQPVVSGALASTVTVANTVTVALDSNSLSALEQVTVTVGAAVALAAGSAQVGSVTISGFTPSTLPPSTVTVGNAVTISSLPEILNQTIANGLVAYKNTENPFPVSIDYAPPISGTVTANNEHLSSNADGNGFPVLRSGVYAYDYQNDIQVGVAALLEDPSRPALNIGGTVTVGTLPSGVDFGSQLAEGYDNYGGAPVQIVASSITLPISGTVTASISGTVPVSGTFWQGTQPVSLAATTVTISASPSGPLTTRFGSVTTANTSQLTSAVTNTSRKFLFMQNISTGIVTVGIGFSPTTTQGIQLSQGSGMTLDSFCPTGAVWWLGATTGAAWTILEG